MPLTFEDAINLQDSYQPTDKEVKRQLKTVLLAPIVGPTAVGKNHLMAILAEKYGYYQAGNVVSRELRQNDPPNVHHRDESDLLKDIENGEVIQFAAFLGNRAIYATVLESYQLGQINTKDIYAHSIESFTEYGFGDVRPVGVVVTPNEWEPRLDKRFSNMDREQRASRLDEAAESIQWILEGSPHIPRVVIIGEDEYRNESIERVHAFVEKGLDVPSEQIHLDTAQQMLERLPRFREKYLKKE